jgi:hypothetical protein
MNRRQRQQVRKCAQSEEQRSGKAGVKSHAGNTTIDNFDNSQQQADHVRNQLPLPQGNAVPPNISGEDQAPGQSLKKLTKGHLKAKAIREETADERVVREKAHKEELQRRKEKKIAREHARGEARRARKAATRALARAERPTRSVTEERKQAKAEARRAQQAAAPTDIPTPSDTSDVGLNPGMQFDDSEHIAALETWNQNQDVANVASYEQLRINGVVFADSKLMDGRSSFPLEFWEDLAGTKLAAAAAMGGEGMYL